MRLNCLALIGLFALSACSTRDVGDEYYDFIDRADRTPAPFDPETDGGVFLDPSGRWLFNIDLGGSGLGEVDLQLTVTFEDFRYVDDSQTTATVDVVFRFPEDAPDAEPLARSEDALIGADGRLAVDIGFVRLEPERSPIEDTAVEVDFVLQAVIIDGTSMCGKITDDESQVYSPIQIKLKGVTFFAQKYGPEGQVPINLPKACPVPEGEEPDADAGVDTGADAADGDDGGGAIELPEGDLGVGQRADITGRHWMSVAVAGSTLALNFVVDANYFEDAESASVDGALRVTTRTEGTTAVAIFSAPVDENGEFTVVVPGLTAESTLGPVSADVALRAKIVDGDTFCGIAAGSVTSPLTLDLAGTTFGSVRMDPGATLPIETGPANAINRCP